MLLIALDTQDLDKRLEAALAGHRLGGPAFHRTLNRTLVSSGAGLAKGAIKATLPDAGARLIYTELEGSPFARALFLIWTDDGRLRVQQLHATRQYGDSMFCIEEAYKHKDSLVLAGYVYDHGNWVYPGIWSYTCRNGRWTKRQELLADWEAAAGVARFERSGHRVSPGTILVSTRRDARRLDNPHGAPHEIWEETWKWKAGAYAKVSVKRKPTPLAALNDIVGFARKGDRTSFARRVPVALRARLWERFRRSEVIAWSDEDVQEDSASSFYIPGAVQPIVVRFGKTGRGWTVKGLEQRP